MFHATLQDGTNLTDLSSGSSSASTGPLPPYGGAPTPTGPENPVDLSRPSQPGAGGGHDPSRANGILHPGANPALPDSTGKSECVQSIRGRAKQNFSGFFLKRRRCSFAGTHSMRGITQPIHKCLSPPRGHFFAPQSSPHSVCEP